MNRHAAEALADAVRHHLNGQRSEMIVYLKGRGFTDKAARKAIENYIETQAFVAHEVALSAE